MNLDKKFIPPKQKEVKKSPEELEGDSDALLTRIEQEDEDEKKVIQKVTEIFDEALALYRSVDVVNADDEGIQDAQEHLEDIAIDLHRDYPDNSYAQKRWQDLQQMILMLKKVRRDRGDASVIYSSIKK